MSARVGAGMQNNATGVVNDQINVRLPVSGIILVQSVPVVDPDLPKSCHQYRRRTNLNAPPLADSRMPVIRIRGSYFTQLLQGC